MPDDSNGIYNVPSGTLVNTGDTVLPSQHNPWALDSAAAISARFSKDGRSPATGDWDINSFRLKQVGNPVALSDAANKQYVDSASTSASSGKVDKIQPFSTLPSSATVSLNTVTSENIFITGTTTITSLGSAQAGLFKRVVFTGALILTHNDTDLILPSSQNINTAAGDTAEFVSYGVDNWRCVSYTRYTGHSVISPIGVGQTWQNVTRSLATNYTNDTVRPIQISVRLNSVSTASVASATLTVGGVTIAIVTLAESNGTIWNPQAQTITAIIPVGVVYSISGTNAAILTWSELR